MKTIKIKGEVYEACEAFPTIFEFEDEDGNEFYFRYRSSRLTLDKNYETIFVYYNDSDDLGGYISWEECCLTYYAKEEVLINDTEVTNKEHKQWLTSDLMSEMFKGLEEK